VHGISVLYACLWHALVRLPALCVCSAHGDQLAVAGTGTCGDMARCVGEDLTRSILHTPRAAAFTLPVTAFLTL
jgi:hypothetical protein